MNTRPSPDFTQIRNDAARLRNEAVADAIEAALDTGRILISRFLELPRLVWAAACGWWAGEGARSSVCRP